MWMWSLHLSSYQREAPLRSKLLNCGVHPLGRGCEVLCNLRFYGHVIPNLFRIRWIYWYNNYVILQILVRHEYRIPHSLHWNNMSTCMDHQPFQAKFCGQLGLRTVYWWSYILNSRFVIKHFLLLMILNWSYIGWWCYIGSILVQHWSYIGPIVVLWWSFSGPLLFL